MILRRVKKLLKIEDDSLDELLLYLIETAIYQVQEYIHDTRIDGLEGIIAQYVAYMYNSGEGTGGEASSSSSSSSSEGGSTIPVSVGELKRESYSGVTFEYTTSADLVSKSSSSNKNSSGSSGNAIDSTYFGTHIAPFLRGRRMVQVIR